jgi:hypothetical protein
VIVDGLEDGHLLSESRRVGNATAICVDTGSESVERLLREVRFCRPFPILLKSPQSL